MYMKLCWVYLSCSSPNIAEKLFQSLFTWKSKFHFLFHLIKKTKLFYPSNFKPTTYNDDDEAVRMHLRGRPIVLYKPTSLDAYNPADASQLPDNKLKLEWV